MKTPLLFALVLILAVDVSLAQANPARDWMAIEALDAGPKRTPSSREETLLLARNHFLLQRKALEDFLQKYPSDLRAPRARLKLAEILATEGQMDGDKRRISEALALMSAVETSQATDPEVRADAGFRRASILMQNAPGGPEQGFRHVVASAQEFVKNHPEDPRGPRLLAEAATVCDAVPEIKRELLLQAQSSTKEEPLLRKIADDLTRLDLLGTPISLEMPSLDGGNLNLADFRGKAVILVFWSSESPQSLLWLHDLRSESSSLSPDSTAIVTVNLDTDREEAIQRARAMDPGWPVGFDGLGWEGPAARSLGINALPTVWALDRSGVLRSLNAKSNPREWARQLSRQQ